VALRPAKPTAIARYGSTAVVVLPGNPSAAFVGLHLLAYPLLSATPHDGEHRVTALLQGDVEAKASRTYAVHVAVETRGSALTARVLENQCSSLVSNAARANGLAIFPPAARRYGEGDIVDVLLVGALRPADSVAAITTAAAMS